MKKLLASLLAVTALVSCSKSGDDNNTYIAEGTFPKKIVAKSPSGRVEHETTYTIQGGKILYFEAIEYEVTGGTRHTQQTLTYNGELPQKTTYVSAREKYTEEYQYEGGKLTKTTQTYEGNTRSTITTYTYEGSQLRKKVIEEPLNSNEGPKTRVIEDEFNYAGNQITVNTNTYIRDAQGVKTGNELSSKVYTIENENLIKVEKSGVVLKEYTYDDKPNANAQKLIQKLNPDYFLDNSFSKNNVLTEKVRHTPNGSQNVYRNAYTYNEKGYVKEKKRYTQDDNGAETLNYTQEYTY